MTESNGENFNIEIKTEPQDHDFEQESSSCIEYQNITEPLELKYEAEDEQIEENPRACVMNRPRKEPIMLRAPAKKGFEVDFKELANKVTSFWTNYEEEMIIRKCYTNYFTSYEITGSNDKLFDMLTSNLRDVDEKEEIDLQSSASGMTFIVIPFGYPRISFEKSNISTFNEYFKETNKNACLPKAELKNGFIKIVYDEFKNLNDIFENNKDIKTIIDDNKHLWKVLECDPHKKPFSIENPTTFEPLTSKKIRISLKDLKNLTESKSDENSTKLISNDIKIKDEPIENPEPINIKQENIEDHPMISNLPLYLTGDQQQEDTYIITELDVKQELTEDDEFSYFTSNFPENSRESRNNDDEDEFQYNTVNSFKSDLATRRSVSHTVVSGKSDKSKAEAALLAMRELMKIEQDKKVEREKSASGLNQVEKPKTMNVSLNVNGVRVVTKVSLPSVDPKIKKLVKSVEEECKFQCPICFIKFKTDGQLIGHKRIHDTAKAKLNTADMTKNVYREVKMRIEQIANRRSIHVLLPNYDYAFIVTNSTANKLYMKCFRQACEVKAYSTNDGKFFVKVGEEHTHGPDREVILSKIDEKKKSDLEKTEVINKSVHEAISQQQRQKSMMEAKKSALIERIKRSQEAVNGKKVIQDAKRRKI